MGVLTTTGEPTTTVIDASTTTSEPTTTITVVSTTTAEPTTTITGVSTTSDATRATVTAAPITIVMGVLTTTGEPTTTITGVSTVTVTHIPITTVTGALTTEITTAPNTFITVVSASTDEPNSTVTGGSTTTGELPSPVTASPATSSVPPTTSVTTTVAGTTTTTTGEPVTVPATVTTTRPTTTTTTYVAPTTTVSRTTSPLSTTSTASTTTTNATTTTTTPITTTSTATTTTATTTTTTAHLQPAPLVSFVIQQVFVEALNDPQSTQFQELAITITAVFDVIYKAKYGILFIRTIVLGFTPIFHSRMDAETQAEVQLVFNETSTQSVPELTDIRNTLKEAVTNPNDFFGNLSVDVTTIIVKAAPATSSVPPTTSVTTTVAGTTTTTTGESVTVPATVPTTRPTTTTTTYVAPTTTVSRKKLPLSTTSTASTTTTNAPTTTTTHTTTTSTTTTTTAHLQPAPLVSFVIQQVFVEALNDPKSTQFQELAITITAVFDVIYKAKYGILFIRTIVLGFTPIFHSRMDAETQAEVQLVFNQTSTQSVPEVTDIRDTLKEAVANPNITFGNISVDVTTIIVQVPTTNKNTTTTATPVITTAIITTTTTETTVVPLTKVTVVFRSSGETFTSELSNTSSQAFQTRALLIRTQLDPFYRSAFTSFNSLDVTEFSSGSIINTMNLAFRSSSVPNSMEIGTVLINAAQKITAFNIDPTSVRVNDTAVTSSGISSKTSLCTAFFLVVLSLLLSSQH
ncbi:integumentary mucin C.1-like isoform X2 [Oncorhynchus mykiss]|uniref:integumentary mucin C.1-like isoform X2 n=1 Tax=Oncorhynchus mykiss TaxID=8022 RepID=UPI00187821DA|nr:integumentary mucin C.1-like isoform X2 [Oncorhynchus mykiss]